MMHPFVRFGNIRYDCAVTSSVTVPEQVKQCNSSDAYLYHNLPLCKMAAAVILYYMHI